MSSCNLMEFKMYIIATHPEEIIFWELQNEALCIFLYRFPWSEVNLTKPTCTFPAVIDLSKTKCTVAICSSTHTNPLLKLMVIMLVMSLPESGSITSVAPCNFYIKFHFLLGFIRWNEWFFKNSELEVFVSCSYMLVATIHEVISGTCTRSLRGIRIHFLTGR